MDYKATGASPTRQVKSHKRQQSWRQEEVRAYIEKVLFSRLLINRDSIGLLTRKDVMLFENNNDNL